MEYSIDTLFGKSFSDNRPLFTDNTVNVFAAPIAVSNDGWYVDIVHLARDAVGNLHHDVILVLKFLELEAAVVATVEINLAILKGERGG